MTAILNKILKRKEKALSSPAAAKEKSVSAAEGAVVRRRATENGVILFPHFTEKSAAAGALAKYVFGVSPRANKIMVKKAVEGRYNVDVAAVNILNTPARERRRGRQIGRRPGFKKAEVTLNKGQSIEMQ